MAIIKATNLHRSFTTGPVVTHILRGVSIDVEPGEFLAIMGKSGAGKSTLMYQLSVLDNPTEGTLFVDGVDVLSLDEKARTSFRLSTLGYVFQDYALVPDLSSLENVILPLLMRGQSFAGASIIGEEALARVGLSGKGRNLPSELSGGEQQRVSIARAVAGNPKIIFADEPTANLDSASGAQVIDLITSLNREHGQTVVMVTHEREYANGVDRIIHMEDGAIVREERLR